MRSRTKEALEKVAFPAIFAVIVPLSLILFALVCA